MMITDLRTEIHRLLKTVSGISASNSRYGEFMRNVKGDYVIFNEVTAPTTQDGDNLFESSMVQFDVFSRTLSTAESLADAICTVMNSASENISLSGRTMNGSFRVSRNTRPLSGDEWRCSIIYEFMLQED